MQESHEMIENETFHLNDDAEEDRNNVALINENISDELATFIASIHDANKERIIQERKELIKERFYLEQRLDDCIMNSELKYLTFENSFTQAKNQEVNSKPIIAEQLSRIQYSSKEMDWILNNPSNVTWREIYRRKNDPISSVEYLNREDNLVKQFNDSMASKDSHIEILKKKSDDYVLLIWNLVVVEVMKEIFDEIIGDLLEIVKFVKHRCGKIFFDATSHCVGKEIAYENSDRKDDDTLSIIIGALDEMRNATNKSYLLGSDFSRGPFINRTQPIFYDNNSSDYKSETLNDRAASLLDLSVTYACPPWKSIKPDSCKFSYFTWDEVRCQSYMSFEKAWFEEHGKDLIGQQYSIDLPPRVGQLTALSLFSRKMNHASLLFVGTSIGRILIWSLPWESESTKSIPVLLSATAPLARNEVSSVISISSGHISCNIFATMFESGHIRVWSLNSKPKKKSSWWFSSSTAWEGGSKFVSTVPTSLFHIRPVDLNIPHDLGPFNSVDILANRQSPEISKLEARSYSIPQSEMFPVFCCFHCEVSLLGNHSSILVGSQGGDIVKFNMDYMVDDLDACIPGENRFVKREFVHPFNVPSKITLASDQSKRLGNAVFREIFHGHKAKIIFISILSIVDKTIVSIDEDNVLSIWTYDSQFFSKKCWMMPSYSTLLDLKHRVYKTIKPLPDKLPSREEFAALISRQRVFLKTEGRIQDVFYPIMSEIGLIEYRCEYPTVESSVGSIFDEYRHRYSPFEASRPIGSPNCLHDAHNVWHRQQVKELELNARIVVVRSNLEGNELYFLIEIQSLANESNISLSSNSKGYKMLCFSILSKEFLSPHPTFALQDETVVLMEVSPILFPHWSRLVLLLTSRNLYFYSLYSGQLLYSNRLAALQSPLSLFAPKFMSFCTSCRWLALSSPDCPRIALHPLIVASNKLDSSVLDENMNTKRDQYLGFPYSAEHMHRWVTAIGTWTPQFQPSLSQQEDMELFNAILSIVEELIIIPVLHTIFEKEAIKRKSENVALLLGGGDGGLGVVEPTVWTQESIDRNRVSLDNGDEIIKFLE